MKCTRNGMFTTAATIIENKHMTATTSATGESIILTVTDTDNVIIRERTKGVAMYMNLVLTVDGVEKKDTGAGRKASRGQFRYYVPADKMEAMFSELKKLEKAAKAAAAKAAKEAKAAEKAAEKAKGESTKE